MSMVGFPLLLIPLAIYNIIAFLMRDVSFAAPLFTLLLTSGTAWPVTLSDVLLALGILLLLLEVIKGARPGAKFLMDHLLSLLVFCGAGAEFVLLPDHPEPKIVHPDVAPSGPSPQVPSPELQPGDGSPASPDAPRR